MSNTAPLKPESVIDAAWGLSLYFSSDDQEKKYGDYLKEHWDNLVKEYTDAKDKRYFHNVNALMSGTVYNLATLRQEKSQWFGYLDSLQEKKLKNLDDLAKLSRDAESIFTRIVGLSIGGGLSFANFASNALGTREIALTVLGAGVFYILFEILLRSFRYCNAPRIMKDTQDRKLSFMKSYYQLKSEGYLQKLLEKISSVSQDVYGPAFKLPAEVISDLAKGSATVQSGAYYISGSIPPADLYSGGTIGSGAFDVRGYTPRKGKILRTNYDNERRTYGNEERK